MGFLDKVQGSLSGNVVNGSSWRDPVSDRNAQSEISKSVRKAEAERLTAFRKVWSVMNAEEKTAYEKANKAYYESKSDFSGEFSGDAPAFVNLDTDSRNHRNFGEWFASLSHEEQLNYMVSNANIPVSEMNHESDHMGRSANVYEDLGLPGEAVISDEDEVSVDSQFGE